MLRDVVPLLLPTHHLHITCTHSITLLVRSILDILATSHTLRGCCALAARYGGPYVSLFFKYMQYAYIHTSMHHESITCALSLFLTDNRFATPQEEIAHLKKLLENKQQELDEVEGSYSEFQEFSKQLEEEMEQDLQAAEKRCADISSQHKRLKEEHDNTLVCISITLKLVHNTSTCASCSSQLIMLT